MEDTYEFDIHKRELVSDCNFYPTDFYQSEIEWLWAQNNKNPRGSYDREKGGKWMLFLSKNKVNAVWDKIKMAVKSGELWKSKVSTVSTTKANHAIMIYTKDYTDLDDVIKVLDYLERSGMKSPHEVIKYKTNQQTRAGIYRGGKEKPWIYSSDTIRKTVLTQDSSSYLSWRNRQPVNQSNVSSSSSSYLSWRNK